jgi:ribonuclease BN (tRNA processing enzyme)
MALELHVLGSEPAWPSASRACSGYLVRSESGVILLDCGTGVFAQLRATLPPESLAAVVITHLHFDHWVDLIPFRYYLKHEAASASPPALYLPPGALGTLAALVAPIDGSPDFFPGAFAASEYDPHSQLNVAELNFRFQVTRHPIATHALRISSDDATLVYTADTGWSPDLADFATGTDLLLCEAAWGAGESEGDMHLSARQAGELATLASARRLLLTHLAAPMAANSVEAARVTYAGPVGYAEPGSVHTIP